MKWIVNHAQSIQGPISKITEFIIKNNLIFNNLNARHNISLLLLFIICNDVMRESHKQTLITKEHIAINAHSILSINHLQTAVL